MATVNSTAVSVGGITWDVREVELLGAFWSGIPNHLLDDVDEVLEQGAQDVMASVQAAFAASPSFHQIARTVSYDRLIFGTSLLYEIGPESFRLDAGSLGGVAVNGGANGGGGTVNIEDALRAGERIDDRIGGVLASLLAEVP